MSSRANAMQVKPGFDWKAFDAYLFDIDGTLLNARGAVHYHSFHTAMRTFWGSDKKIDTVPLHGNTDIGILRAALAQDGITDEEFEAKLPQALELMCAEVERGAANVVAELCPAIGRILQELHDAGKTLGVASGNLERIGRVKLRAAGIDHYFQFGSFSDRRPTRVEIFRHGAKLALDLAQVRDASIRKLAICFIGDTPNDIEAAHALQRPVIAVATGIHSFDTLAALGPEMCLGCCEELWSGAESL